MHNSSSDFCFAESMFIIAPMQRYAARKALNHTLEELSMQEDPEAEADQQELARLQVRVMSYSKRTGHACGIRARRLMCTPEGALASQH